MKQLNPSKRDEEEKAKKENTGEISRNSEYWYQTAGVRERSGYIPLWLKMVAIGLLVWAVYYLQKFWTPNG